MTKSESKYFNTARKMDEAFLDLIETKDFEYITVTEICEKAGVNRSTFYLHYETIGDVLSESIDYMNQEFLKYFPQDEERVSVHIREMGLSKLYLITPEYMTPYLQYIKDNRKLFKAALNKSTTLHLKDSFEGLFMQVLNPIMERFQVQETARRYIVHFYIGALMAVIEEWLKNECVDEIDFIIKIIIDLAGKPKGGEIR